MTIISEILATPLQPLKRISPSRYVSLISCSLREILASNPAIPKLLPDSPEAKLGTVIHKLLELAAKGAISDLAEASVVWTSEVSKIEKETASNSLEKYLIPLSQKARNYEVKRSQCFLLVKSILLTRSQSVKRTTRGGLSINTELWVETPDKKVGGKIDAVRQDHGVEIVDYKTGNVVHKRNGSSSIREDYETQLKLYAALYFSTYQSWPSRLLIIGLSGEEYEVNFKREECLSMLKEASELIDRINEKIQSGCDWQDLANPSPAACRYCQFRPVCSAYIRMQKDGEGWPIDVFGIVQSKTLLKNGIRLAIQCDGHLVAVRGLSPERHEILSAETGPIMILNLYRDTSSNCYLESPLTVCYEFSNEI